MLAKHLKYINLVSLYVEMKDFLRVGVCTFTVESVRRPFLPFVLWFCFAFFVSVLVPRARWHPVKPALYPLVL